MKKQFITIGLAGMLSVAAHQAQGQTDNKLMPIPQTSEWTSPNAPVAKKQGQRPTEVKQRMVASSKYSLGNSVLELKDSIIYTYSNSRGSYPEYVDNGLVRVKSNFDTATTVYSVDTTLTVPYINATQNFNNDNLLVKGFNYNNDGDTLKTITIAYHTNGKMQHYNSMEYFPLRGNGDEYTYMDKQYNAEGNIVKDTIMQHVPSMGSVYWFARGLTYEYDAQNRMTYYEADQEGYGSPSFKDDYKRWSFYNGTSANKYKDSLLHINIFNNNPPNYDSSNTYYQYNAAGNMTEGITVNFNSGDTTGKFTYTYNSNDELIRHSRFTYTDTGNNWHENYRVDYEYDNNGNTSKKINYQLNGTTNQFYVLMEELYFHNTKDLWDSVHIYFLDWQSDSLRLGNVQRYWYSNFDNITKQERIDYNTNNGAINSHSIDFNYYEDFLSLKDLNAAILDVEVFPNPAMDKVNINIRETSNLQLYHISIYDLSGKMIKQSNLYGTTTTINVLDISSGIYLLEITDTQNMKKFLHKLVKE